MVAPKLKMKLEKTSKKQKHNGRPFIIQDLDESRVPNVCFYRCFLLWFIPKC